MRRKLTAALLTAAMAISLTACGGSGDTASAGASTGETASVTEAGGTTTASGKEVLRVAMSADYAPFDWLQEDDSNGAVMTSNGSYMNGYDVLVAKYIAEKLDMDLEITQIDWDGLILSIQSGKVDCAIAGMSITSERSQSVDFSDPYYNANIVAVVAADGPYADAVNVTDFEGATLTSTLNTVWYDVLDQITDYATKPELKIAEIEPQAEACGSIIFIVCFVGAVIELLVEFDDSIVNWRNTQNSRK